MDVIKIKSFKKYIPLLTVLLFAIYPILALYAYNVEEVVLDEILFPLLFSLLFSMILMGFWKLVLKNNYKAGMATIFFLLIFWNYSLISRGANRYTNLEHWHLLPIIIFIYMHLIYFIGKIKDKKTLNNFNIILSLPIGLLIIFNLLTILPAELKKSKALGTNKKAVPGSLTTSSNTSYPDIYLIIFDEYANPQTMKEEWDYDNTKFYQFLRDKGFFVAENSETRSLYTNLSVPTILNLEYINSDLAITDRHLKYNQNLVFRFLDNLGYQITFLDGYGRSNRNMEVQDLLHIFYKDIAIQEASHLSEFAELVLDQTIISSFDLFKNEQGNVYYSANKNFFNYINGQPAKVNKLEQPNFLFAHIMSPHLPFVFDRNGNFLENPTNYWEYKTLESDQLKRLYLEQYIYVTKRIEEIVENILEKSDSDPIIILLSDHGPRLVSAGIDNDKLSRRVLNAVYFPQKDYQDLYKSIAPVNTMRAVLNNYFGENYPMLEDK